MSPQNTELSKLKQEYRLQVELIGKEKDAVERSRQSEELKDIMEAMFSVDMEQRQAELELQVAKLEEQRASYESRKSQNEQIIRTKLEQVLGAINKEIIQGGSEDIVSEVLDGHELFAIPKPKTIDARFHVVSDNCENGVRRMKLHAVWLKPENRSNEVPFVVVVEQTRSFVIDGTKIEYTVGVPEQRSRKEIFKVQVPVSRVLEIEVANGEDWEQVAREKLARKPRGN